MYVAMLLQANDRDTPRRSELAAGGQQCTAMHTAMHSQTPTHTPTLPPTHPPTHPPMGLGLGRQPHRHTHAHTHTYTYAYTQPPTHPPTHPGGWGWGGSPMRDGASTAGGGGPWVGGNPRRTARHRCRCRGCTSWTDDGGITTAEHI
jgi:hypothetical protein